MVFERRRTRRVGKLEWYAEGREEELRNEEKIIEIIEFSCPYGYISRGRDTLERAYDEKKRKYMELALNLKRLRREEVRLTVMIVSSMGAVYDRSLKDLQRVLGCTDRKMPKLGRQMAETVIMGSMEIWRQNVHEIPPGPAEIANLLIEGEVAQLDEEIEEQAREGEVDSNPDLDEERDRAEDHQESYSDEEFEPEAGLEDATIEIDDGFIRAEARET
jgi:phosphatidylserine/phosphatidylglycerophosphate/cardiolipin synthase-like enzyme